MKLVKFTQVVVVATSVASFNTTADNLGTVDFIGTVVSTPCNIAQSSLKQTIDFGQLSRRALENGRVAEVKYLVCIIEKKLLKMQIKSQMLLQE